MRSLCLCVGGRAKILAERAAWDFIRYEKQ